MILYMTRHGESEYNVTGRYCGITDIPLHERGFAQAQELAKSLQEQGMAFDVVISSPLLRARQTADAICEALGMEYVVDERFRERDFGVYEGVSRDEVKDLFPEMYARQCTNTLDDAPDGGETIRQVYQRVDEGLDQLRQIYQGKAVLLVCHGMTARAVNRYCWNTPYEEVAGFSIGNCEIVQYEL